MALTLAPLGCLGAAVPLELTLVKGGGGMKGAWEVGVRLRVLTLYTHVCAHPRAHTPCTCLSEPPAMHTRSTALGPQAKEGGTWLPWVFTGVEE